MTLARPQTLCSSPSICRSHRSLPCRLWPIGLTPRSLFALHGSGRVGSGFWSDVSSTSVRLLRAGEPSRRVLLKQGVVRHSDGPGPGSRAGLFGAARGHHSLWGRQWMPALCSGIGFRYRCISGWRSSSSWAREHFTRSVVHRLRASAIGPSWLRPIVGQLSPSRSAIRGSVGNQVITILTL